MNPLKSEPGTSSSYEVLAPEHGNLAAFRSKGPLQPFASETLNFLEALSRALMHGPDVRRFPEIVALGYWLRASHLREVREQTQPRSPKHLLVPLGSAFHIAPGNVDTIFVYSWCLAMLAGNSNIVRVSRRTSPQFEIVLGRIAGLFADPAYGAIASRTLLVRYDHDPRITAELSTACDVRVVWGGDGTVDEIRKVALPALAKEIVFPDRFSLALIRAQSWLVSDDRVRGRAAEAFVNDAYWFSQMACSSPRLVLWHGTAAEVHSARESFWGCVRGVLVRRPPTLEIGDYINKRVSTAAAAVLACAKQPKESDGNLTRLWFESPPELPTSLHCGAGLFWESRIDSLEEVTPALSRRTQTVTHFGFERRELEDYMSSHRPRGADRWVPFGDALAFHEVWDGMDLMKAFLREVVIQLQ
jgi:hypothetical protein